MVEGRNVSDQLTGDQHYGDGGYLSYYLARLDGSGFAGEIAAYAAAQPFGFAYVKELACCVVELVDAWGAGQLPCIAVR